MKNFIIASIDTIHIHDSQGFSISKYVLFGELLTYCCRLLCFTSRWELYTWGRKVHILLHRLEYCTLYSVRFHALVRCICSLLALGKCELKFLKPVQKLNINMLTYPYPYLLNVPSQLTPPPSRYPPTPTLRHCPWG